jgi:hypothetical protein
VVCNAQGQISSSTPCDKGCNPGNNTCITANLAPRNFGISFLTDPNHTDVCTDSGWWPSPLASWTVSADLTFSTNPAAGVRPEPLVHDEVMEVARRVRAEFSALLEAIIERL